MTIVDDDLARVLASVGRHLDTAGDTEQTDHARRHDRLVLVAAAVIVAALVTMAIAPVRRAVADWLGIGSTTVVHVPADGAPISTPVPITSGLSQVDAAEARQRLGRALPDTSSSSLGPPQTLLAMPEGGVLMVWRDGASTLWVHDADRPPMILVKKLISADQQARFVDGLGDGALAVVGDHVLVTPHRTVAAHTVLLWTVGDTEYRLESDLPLDAMIATAHEIR